MAVDDEPAASPGVAGKRQAGKSIKQGGSGRPLIPCEV